MSVESQLYEIRLKTDQFKTALDNVESKMNGFESKITGVGSTLKGVFGGTLLADAFKGVIGLMKDTVTESINVAREFQNMKDAISFASGDQATTNLKFLDTTIKELGLDAQSTYKGFKTFQGALMGTELEGEKGRDIFLAVSKAASVMKLSAEQTEGTFLALGQMVSKGTVQAEELRGQLGERLPGAFQIFARALGTSTAGLGKMLQKGEVLANDALPKFATELEKIFGPGVKSAQNSFNANWNRFQNTLLDIKLFIGNSLMPILNDFFNAINTTNFSGFIDGVKNIGSALGDVIGIAMDLKNILTDQDGNFLGVNWGNAFGHLALHVKTATAEIRLALENLTHPFAEFTKKQLILEGELKQLYSDIEFYHETGGLRHYQNEANGEMGPNPASKNPFDLMALMGKSSKGGGAFGTSGASSASGIGVEKVASSTRNININIDNLVKEINFNKAQNFRESESELVDRVRRALLTMVNDVNIVAQ